MFEPGSRTRREVQQSLDSRAKRNLFSSLDLECQSPLLPLDTSFFNLLDIFPPIENTNLSSIVLLPLDRRLILRLDSASSFVELLQQPEHPKDNQEIQHRHSRQIRVPIGSKHPRIQTDLRVQRSKLSAVLLLHTHTHFVSSAPLRSFNTSPPCGTRLSGPHSQVK